MGVKKTFRQADHPLRVLQVEDAATDAELILRELKRHKLSFESKRVWTEADFIAALSTFVPDIILSDNSMPRFDGLQALKISRELAPGTPFIFVSGSIRPEDAEIALKSGALAYLVKDDVTRLVATMRKAVENTKTPSITPASNGMSPKSAKPES
jgi:CheY-like chemotaxis protein